jgi:hypothetical protein
MAERQESRGVINGHLSPVKRPRSSDHHRAGDRHQLGVESGTLAIAVQRGSGHKTSTGSRGVLFVDPTIAKTLSVFAAIP